MKDKIKSALKLIPLVILFIFAIIYRSTIIASIQKLSIIQPTSLVLLLFLYSLGWYLKGYKWRLLLNTTVFSNFQLANIILLGNFTSLFVPAKSGDLVRLKLTHKTDFTKTEIVASMIVDRIWDLFGIIFAAILVSMVFAPSFLLGSFLYFGIFIGTLAFIITLYLLLPKIDTKLIDTTPKKLRPTVESIFKGIQLTKNSDLPIIISISTLIWMIEGIILHIILIQFFPEVSIWISVIAVLIANLTKIFPLTPGGFVIYEGTIAFILQEFTTIGIETGLQFGILDSIFKNGYTIIIGLFSYYYWFLRKNHE